MVERDPVKIEVRGSNPRGGAELFLIEPHRRSHMRIPTPKDVEADVLFKANHTCSICNDPSIGVQVAHIDDNPSNNNEANLIVLCVNHHDKAHLKSPISKSYTKQELKKYKNNWGNTVKLRRKALESPQLIRLIRFDGMDVNTVYLEIEQNVLRGFQDSLTFELLGFNWGNVDIFPDSYKSKFIFQKPLEKTSDSKKIRLKFSNGTHANEVYIIWEDGRKHWIPDPETLREIGGFSNIIDIDFLEFNAIPHGQPLINIFTIRTNRILKEAMSSSPSASSSFSPSFSASPSPSEEID